ncbi:hypothetical protein GGTG_06398 [Gaeumannomyces tritici R3-111a-1]|uniref:Thaumatin family protein n=1 Tax=Gaeumannomyces tritici (strain R3-111a-1) TaxID=644352 RepID=J3NYP6_GAET3|nr:hypothetical protein GGTG_06398 [Gaeumannomyces tritici R3-111a-1]EJT76479.1 hypothetical protein GGTG_06398 [Gaeumannomyces tritici R3-111a-1]
MRATLVVAALLGLAMATPQPTLVAKVRRQEDSDEPGPLVGEPDVIDPATYPLALGGAIDMALKASASGTSPLLPAETETPSPAGEDPVTAPAPAPTAAPDLAERQDGAAILARAPTRLTFKIWNSHGSDVSTRHARNAGAPAPVAGNVGAGVLKNGKSASFVVPRDWAGNVAIVQNGGGRAIVGDESLIEGAFVRGEIGINISFVSGYSVPIVCACAETNRMVVGCNKNLWGLGTCPNNNGKGSCKNPTRTNTGATSPTQFFAPCRGAAYTFPRDNKAMAHDICKGGTINCCIGTKCRKSVLQS